MSTPLTHSVTVNKQTGLDSQSSKEKITKEKLEWNFGMPKEPKPTLCEMQIAILREKIIPPSCPNSLVPYHVIRYMATHKNYENLMRSALMTLHKGDRQLKRRDLITSCVYSTYAMALVFFGNKFATHLLDIIEKQYSITLSFNLPSGKNWNCNITKLFDGVIIRKILSTLSPDALTSRDEEYIILECTDKFSSKLKEIESLANETFTISLTEKLKVQKDIVVSPDNLKNDEKCIEKIKHVLSNLDYSFNRSVIHSLKKEIRSNHEVVSESTTCVYYIAILAPTTELKRYLTFFHKFFIEQYFHENEVRYRLYQSWLEDATLGEDILSKDKTKNGGSWNKEECENFLNKLKVLYCNLQESDKKIRTKDCFGYSDDEIPLTQFDGQTLYGLSLRYVSAKIKPEKCLANFVRSYSDELDITNSKKSAQSRRHCIIS